MSVFYSDSTVTLHRGDALEVLRGLPDGSVDCVVTSPPYYGLRDYGSDSQIGLEPTVAEYVDALVDVFSQVYRVLSDRGTLWLNLGDSYAGSNKGRNADGSHSAHVGGLEASNRGAVEGRLDLGAGDLPRKNLLGIPWRVAFGLQDAGWVLRNEIIWEKPNAMPSPVSDRLTVKHESVFLFSKSPEYFFDLDPIKVPVSSSPRALSFARASKEAQHPSGSGLQHRQNRVSGVSEFRNPGDVWKIPTSGFSGAHFATFPLDLPLRCISAGCVPSGVVLDPFSGSGTTGLAAAQLGCRYIGIDVNEEYLELSLQTRLSQPALVEVV